MIIGLLAVLFAIAPGMEVCRALILNKPRSVPSHPSTPAMQAAVNRQAACYRQLISAIQSTGQ